MTKTHSRRGLITGWTLLVLVVGASTSQAQQQWGTLTGKFIFSGNAPAPAAIGGGAAAGICGVAPIDESLVVGPKGELMNVVVFLRTKAGQNIIVHPNYAKAANDTIVLANQQCRFEPHVLALRTSQTLRIANPANIAHNSKIDPFASSAINPIIPAGQFHNHIFQKQEALPTKVSCSIHPWMSSWVLVRDDPYFAVSDRNGDFKIEDLAVDTYDFVFWHERCGYLTNVIIGGKAAKLNKGRLDQEIKAGNNPLGNIDAEIK